MHCSGGYVLPFQDALAPYGFEDEETEEKSGLTDSSESIPLSCVDLSFGAEEQTQPWPWGSWHFDVSFVDSKAGAKI